MDRLPLVLDRRSGGMPHFDIIHRMAQETKKAASLEAACPTLLPLLDELGTFCDEHKIEEIPAFDSDVPDEIPLVRIRGTR